MSFHPLPKFFIIWDWYVHLSALLTRCPGPKCNGLPKFFQWLGKFFLPAHLRKFHLFLALLEVSSYFIYSFALWNFEHPLVSLFFSWFCHQQFFLSGSALSGAKSCFIDRRWCDHLYRAYFYSFSPYHRYTRRFSCFCYKINWAFAQLHFI